jgi:ribonuclease R
MRDKVGARYEGTVTGLAGSGIYVALDSPFVDVMVKFDALGGSGWELDDTGLRATGGNGQEVKLGDRLLVEIIDVAILRRTVYARRISGGGDDPARGKRSRERGAEGPAKGAPGAKAAKRDVRAKVRKVESRKGGAGKTGGKSKGGGKRKR